MLRTDAALCFFGISSQHEIPYGVLKISAPISFGHVYLADLLPQFLQTYPDVQMEVNFDDRLVDVIAEGYDVVIRITNLKDTSLISRKIMSSSIITLASPEYLSRIGCPAHPRDLVEHDCISYAYLQRPAYWDYLSASGEPMGVTVKPQVICNNDELQRSMAVAGLGIIRIPAFCCQGELSTGALVPILKEYEFSDLGVYAIYPHRRNLSTKVRVFVDFLVERLGM